MDERTAVVELSEQDQGADALTGHCRTLIAGYKKPKYVRFLEPLPRNSTGKVAKAELCRLAREDASSDDITDG